MTDLSFPRRAVVTGRCSRLWLLMGLAVLAGGCVGSGRFAVTGHGVNEAGPVVLVGRFDTAVYRFADRNQVDVLLIEGTVDEPTQVVHVKMMWRPRAARTPVDRRATNSVVRYIVFTPTGAGVYGGGGFTLLKSNPGGKSLRVDMRQVTLRLIDHSEKFHDRLGLASASGGFSAKRDDRATRDLLRKIQQKLNKHMGYPLFVAAPTDGARG